MITTTTTTMPKCTSASVVGRILKDTGPTTSSGPNISGVPTDSTGPDELIVIGVIMATGVMVTMATGVMATMGGSSGLLICYSEFLLVGMLTLKLFLRI